MKDRLDKIEQIVSMLDNNNPEENIKCIEKYMHKVGDRIYILSHNHKKFNKMNRLYINVGIASKVLQIIKGRSKNK